MRKHGLNQTCVQDTFGMSIFSNQNLIVMKTISLLLICCLLSVGLAAQTQTYFYDFDSPGSTPNFLSYDRDQDVPISMVDSFAVSNDPDSSAPDQCLVSDGFTFSFTQDIDDWVFIGPFTMGETNTLKFQRKAGNLFYTARIDIYAVSAIAGNTPEAALSNGLKLHSVLASDRWLSFTMNFGFVYGVIPGEDYYIAFRHINGVSPSADVFWLDNIKLETKSNNSSDAHIDENEFPDQTMFEIPLKQVYPIQRGRTVSNVGTLLLADVQIESKVFFNDMLIQTDTSYSFNILPGKSEYLNVGAFTPTKAGYYRIENRVIHSTIDSDSTDNYYEIEFIVSDKYAQTPINDSVRERSNYTVGQFEKGGMGMSMNPQVADSVALLLFVLNNTFNAGFGWFYEGVVYEEDTSGNLTEIGRSDSVQITTSGGILEVPLPFNPPIPVEPGKLYVCMVESNEQNVGQFEMLVGNEDEERSYFTMGDATNNDPKPGDQQQISMTPLMNIQMASADSVPCPELFLDNVEWEPVNEIAPGIFQNWKATITVSGGTGPYNYEWADFDFVKLTSTPLPACDGQSVCDKLIPYDPEGSKRITHQVTVTDINGCQQTFTLFPPKNFIYGNTTTSVETIDPTQRISAFPNPTTGLIQFDLPKSEEFLIELINMEGQVIQRSDRALLDLSALPKGVYIARIQTVDFEKRVKILKH